MMLARLKDRLTPSRLKHFVPTDIPKYLCTYIYTSVFPKQTVFPMKGTCVNKSNAKCIRNEPESLQSKGKPHSRG